MNIAEIKDLMAQFDASSLTEFAYASAAGSLTFSKNQGSQVAPVVAPLVAQPTVEPAQVTQPVVERGAVEDLPAQPSLAGQVQGEVVESPLVGVAYLSPSPDKPAFVQVGDSVKKGQTLLIVEAMKVMNEVPAPRDGVVTEILVANEAVIEYGQGLVRIK